MPIPNLNALKSARARLRLAAFGLDAAILGGLSVSLAEWLSVLMLRVLLKAKAWGDGDIVFAQFFFTAFRYSFCMVWPLTLLFLGFLYYVCATHLWGATFGQNLFNLRVVTRAGELPNIERSGTRFFASLATLFSGGIFYFWGARVQFGIYFHDDVSGTRVVEKSSWPRGFALGREPERRFLLQASAESKQHAA